VFLHIQLFPACKAGQLNAAHAYGTLRAATLGCYGFPAGGGIGAATVSVATDAVCRYS